MNYKDPVHLMERVLLLCNRKGTTITHIPILGIGINRVSTQSGIWRAPILGIQMFYKFVPYDKEIGYWNQ